MSGGASPDGRLILDGRFETVRLLGRGASGQVVLARQLSLDRLVAVKLLYATADAADVQRLQREGRVLAQLTHPHIVPVHELVVGGDDVALVMEYIEGGSLADALAMGMGMDVSSRLAILAGVASALEAAHAVSIVHRDVKPANVLLGRQGALLGDFGLARPFAGSAAFRTLDESVAGTPEYLAPEVAAGGEPSASADAFAFAVVAAQLLDGFDPGGVPSPSRTSVPALAAALGVDPEARPGPSAVVDELSRLPHSAWVMEVASQAAPETRRSGAPAGQITERAGARPPTYPRKVKEVSAARDRHRGVGPAVWVGAVIGLVVGVAVLILWL